MDEAVAHAYGWDDLKLEHGFHETKQGLRYMISEEARREVLDRLLLLNHERHEEEVRAGLFETKGAKGKAGKTRKVAKRIIIRNLAIKMVKLVPMLEVQLQAITPYRSGLACLASASGNNALP